MSSFDLKPCPFCGGEAQVIGKQYEGKFCVGCSDDTCMGFSGLGWLYDSEDGAAAAWNRRAERTCRVVPTGDEYGTSRCTECGQTASADMWGSLLRYCPNCGAKVEMG